MKKLNLNAIRIDGGTQSRVEINLDAVADYADSIRSGAEMPAVVVFHDGADYWLADGFHRYHAHKAAEKASILADVQTGTQRDAVLYSLGANRTHGLRRTNQDKRKAVETLLKDSEWSSWSDNQIAKACGVHHSTVSEHRRSLAESASEKPAERTYTTKHGTTAVMKTENIGGKKQEPKRQLHQAEAAPTEADNAEEARHAIEELAAENERLSDRLAVEAMDVSEEEKTAAAQTIADLRERVRVLEIEVSALKASRDTYMRESAERLKQIKYLQRQVDRAAA